MTKRSRLDDPSNQISQQCSSSSQQCSSCHKFKIPNAFIHPTSGRVGKTCAECIIRKSASTKAGAAAEVEAVLLEHARQLARLNERLTELERVPRSVYPAQRRYLEREECHSPPGALTPPDEHTQNTQRWQSQADYLEQMLLRDPHLCAGISPFADLAEWFALRDPAEKNAPVPGDLVEMRDRKISREITGDGVLFVVTTAPFFVGNAPKDAAAYAGGRAVVMIGQAPVNVVGPVKSNAVLVPSGRNDGTAMAGDGCSSGIVAMEDARKGKVMCLVNAGVVIKAKVSVKTDSKEEYDEPSVQARLKFVGSAVDAAAKIGRRARVLLAVQEKRTKLDAIVVIARFLRRRPKVNLRQCLAKIQAFGRGKHCRSVHPVGRILAKLRRLSPTEPKMVINVEAPVARAELVFEDTLRLTYRDPDSENPTFVTKTDDFWNTIPTTLENDLAEAYFTLHELPTNAVIGVISDGAIRYTWKASQLLAISENGIHLNAGRAHGSAAKYFRKPKTTILTTDDDSSQQHTVGVILAAATGAAISEDLAAFLRDKVKVEVIPPDEDSHLKLMAAEPATILDVQDDCTMRLQCQCLDLNTQHVVDTVKTLPSSSLRLRLE